jgi:hypothetical protein
MQYMFLITKLAQMNESERGKMYGAYAAYNEELKQAGVLRGLNWLREPDAATTLRPASGPATVHDGPFLTTKENLGGYYLIEVADLDEAMKWAQKCPGLYFGGVEIRPVIGTI